MITTPVTSIILHRDDGSSTSVLADVHGQWASHPNTDGPGWRVSHVPTGMNLAQLVDELDEATAKQLAGELDARAPRFEGVKDMPAQAIMDLVKEVTRG